MTLYEIDQRLTDLVDPETGELLDLDAFDALQMERDAKIEGVALWIKDLRAERKAISDEINTLHARRAAIDKKTERLMAWLARALDGQKFETAKAAVSFRRSTIVEIPDAKAFEAKYGGVMDALFRVTRSPDKTAIKQTLQAGVELEGASLIERNNVNVR